MHQLKCSKLRWCELWLKSLSTSIIENRIISFKCFSIIQTSKYITHTSPRAHCSSVVENETDDLIMGILLRLLLLLLLWNLTMVQKASCNYIFFSSNSKKNNASHSLRLTKTFNELYRKTKENQKVCNTSD